MAEVLIDPNLQPSMSPEQQVVDGPLTYRERIRRSVGRMGEGAMSLLDLGAGIALARDDLRLTRNGMNQLDEPYGGMLKRQAASDAISMDLESDIILDFRRDAQRLGFTDLEAMPSDQRTLTARLAIEQRTADITEELVTHHPDWTPEELAETVSTRTTDFATLLGMDAQERDEYLAAQLEYQELQLAVPEIQSELSELRAERNERVSRIGSVAMRGIVSFAGRVRDLPNTLSARAVVAGMAVSDRLHSIGPEKRRKAFWKTAGGVAIAGIAGYIAMRAGSGHGFGSGNNYNYALANSSSPLLPDHVGGSGLPDHVGTPSGYPTPDHIGSATPTPEHTGSAIPTPNHIGSADVTSSIDHVGTDTQAPNHVGSSAATSNHVGSASPDHLGTPGENLSSVKTSSELFSSTNAVDKWPSTITVSHWDSRDLDGSLTGISKQLLIRSGVSDPSQDQITILVDSLRPQAQPNGYLLYGQQLDLRPATETIRGIL
jgi:hypothetical protein